MKQSSIMNAPRFFDERKSDVQKSPYPARTTRKMVSNENMAPPFSMPVSNYGTNQSQYYHNYQQVNHSLAHSRVDNFPKPYNQNLNLTPVHTNPLGHMHSASQLNQYFKRSTIFNNTTNFENCSESRVSNQPNVAQDKISNFNTLAQNSELSQSIKHLTDKVTQLSKKTHKNTQKINTLQRFYEQNSSRNNFSDMDINCLKEKILEELRIGTPRDNTRVSMNEIQRVKLQVMSFTQKLMSEKEIHLSNFMKEMKFTEDEHFRKAITQKLNIQISQFKESMIHEIKSLKSKLDRQLDAAIQIERVELKDTMKKHISELVEKSNFRANEQQVTRRSSHQYLFRPLLLRYKGILKVETVSRNQQYELDSEMMTYHIDNEGYLLDEHCYYILDTKGSKIRLPPQQARLITSLCLK